MKKSLLIATVHALAIVAVRPSRDLILLWMTPEVSPLPPPALCLKTNQFSFYNAEIKDAVDKYWKVTPLKFITEKEFNVMRTDPSYSFIVLTITNFSNDKSGSAYDFLNLLLGADVDNLDEIARVLRHTALLCRGSARRSTAISWA